MICKDPAKLHRELRKKYKYNNEVKFEKISRKRYAIYLEFLKMFQKSFNTKFKCVLVNKKEVGIKHFRFKRWVRFNMVADDLINSVVKNSEEVKIFADEKTSPAEDNFSKYLLTHVIGTKEVVVVNSKDYDLVQLCDLLLGAVRAKFEGIVKNRLKKEIIKVVLSFSAEKVGFYEYKIRNGQPSETESGRVS